jgi:hypothetical protein
MRPYEAIGMGRPAEICQHPNRTEPKRIDPYNYPSHYLGGVPATLEQSMCFTSRYLSAKPLHEDYFELEEVDDGVGVYDLFFCFYHVGRYELRMNKIHDTLSNTILCQR